MNKIYAFLILCLAFTLPASAAVKVGSQAPDFTGKTSNDTMVNLSDFSDKTVILEWTNHDCPFVVKHYKSGNMQALQKETTDQDIVWLSVISSAPGKQGYVDAAKANMLTTSRNAQPSNVILDPSGDIGRMYGAQTTPHMYVIEKGTLVYAGAIDSIKSANPKDIPKATNYVRQALDERAAGKEVSEPLTKAYGCSVKY